MSCNIVNLRGVYDYSITQVNNKQAFHWGFPKNDLIKFRRKNI